jgi:hypothetical protein
MNKKSTFEFKLKKPINLQVKKSNGDGFDIKKSSKLILQAPSIKKHYFLSNKLQSLFCRSMLETQSIFSKSNFGKNAEREEKKDDELFTSEFVRLILLTGGGDNMNEYYEIFDELLLSDDICSLENGNQLTEVEMNEIDYFDKKELAVEYTKIFFIISWMKEIGMGLK